MKNTKQLFIATALFLTGLMNAQVGIGTITPEASAELEISSTTKGFLPPRMTKSQMIDIASPALGLTVYCTDCSTQGLFTNTLNNISSWQHITGTPSYDATGNLPGSLATFYNGWVAGVYTGTPAIVNHSAYTTSEKFSENTSCGGASILISRGGTCPTTVSVGTAPNINVYNTVNINGQCWMKTNLKEIPISYASSNNGATAWLNTTKLADVGNWGFYNYDDVTGASNFAASEYAAGEGMLYQWKAAMNGSTNERAQGVCPAGWHIPSDCEFMYLEHGLGMSLASQVLTGPRGSGASEGEVGTKLRTAGGNASGFSGILSGRRDNLFTGGNSFVNRTSNLFIWTSTGNATSAYYRVLSTGGKQVQRSNVSTIGAYSVRCLKN